VVRELVVVVVALVVAGTARADQNAAHDWRPRAAASARMGFSWRRSAEANLGGVVVGDYAGTREAQRDWVPVLFPSAAGFAGSFIPRIIAAMSAPGTDVGRPAHDGMSVREIRPDDASGRVMIPLMAGRF
jgi:hypothetical protein